jgi:hypothetical protein
MARRPKLTWRGTELFLGDRKIGEVTRDDNPRTRLLRVRYSDGEFSDRVNLSRARDAAEALAIATPDRARRSGSRKNPRTAILAKAGTQTAVGGARNG